jgi:cell wall assembly regulator SMI1
LPGEAELFFRIHNGQTEEPASALITTGDEADARFRLLPVKEVIAEWQVWNDLIAQGEFRTSVALPDRGVAKEWFDPGWVPLTTDGQGDHHCLDLSPGPGGRAGQIIMVWHDSPARQVVADSLMDWLDELASLSEEA